MLNGQSVSTPIGYRHIERLRKLPGYHELPLSQAKSLLGTKKRYNMGITYHVGDATNPVESGYPRFIIHCCNNIGGWGSGFVCALSNRWKKPEQDYRKWFRDKKIDDELNIEVPFKLGEIQVCEVQDGLYAINMIGQNGVIGPDNPQPVDYEAIADCLDKVAKTVHLYGSIHCPRFGSGLAGGDWNTIKMLINLHLPNHNVNVYDLPNPK